jgi:hypothetical protein
LEDSAKQPSLGIKLRIVSIRGNEKKNRPGEYYFNETILRI